MTTATEPFTREELLDKPGIIGARWWQRSLEATNPMARRTALMGLLVGGAVLAGTGLFVAAVSSGGSSDYRMEPRPALDLQRSYGWSFGANAETLTFDGQSKRPFDRDALTRLRDDLRPSNPSLAPYYVPTLFASLVEEPKSIPVEDTTHPTPLKTVLTPIFTPKMDLAYRRGRALASLLKGIPGLLLVIDLPGPESVAFAAGASAVFDPVFGFDNWPHPRGVVKAHETLAAAAYYQPLFAKHAGGRGPGAIVLDRSRLTPYTDDSTQFDNRHVAKLPDVVGLKKLSVSHVLYVAPDGTTDQELDDLNDDLVLYARAGVDVRFVGASAFGPDPAEPKTTADDDHPTFYYGASAASHGWFLHDYPWGAVPPSATAPHPALGGPEWRPNPRVTPYSSGAPGATSPRPRPPNFGTAIVAISVATGLILGARIFRSGSWYRSGGSSWGG